VPKGGELFEVKLGDFKEDARYDTVDIPRHRGVPQPVPGKKQRGWKNRRYG
jgi:hypothetical protein